MSENPRPQDDATRRMTDTQEIRPTDEMPRVERVRPNRRMARRSNPFLLPIWSIALMLVAVAATAGGVVFLVLLLGGNMPIQSQPRIVIVTAPATETPTVTPTSESPAASEFGNGVAMPLPTFALEGPTLQPVYLSPTPDSISVGRTVQVINVGENGLNIRSGPGINNTLLFTARENSMLEVLDGPQQTPEDSYTWWQIRDPFTGETGWAVDLYMEVQPETTP